MSIRPPLHGYKRNQQTLRKALKRYDPPAPRPKAVEHPNPLTVVRFTPPQGWGFSGDDPRLTLQNWQNSIGKSSGP